MATASMTLGWYTVNLRVWPGKLLSLSPFLAGSVPHTFQSLVIDSDKLSLNVYQVYSRQSRSTLLLMPGCGKGNDYSHSHTSTCVLGPLYRVRYLLKYIPLSSFFCNKSRSLKQSIRSMCTSSLFRHISRHWSIESSIQYTLGFSTRR